MQLPIVTPAPVVSQHAEIFRPEFGDERTFRHFQNYLTGLMVLANKSMSNISRCTLDSADKTNLSRFLRDAPWQPTAVQARCISYMLSQTVGLRQPESASELILDDTLCEHVGSLFEHVEHHYNHSDGSYPYAHNLVTSHYRSGAVRFPVEFAIYQRYESATQWQAFMAKHFPEETLRCNGKERAKLHRRVDPILKQDPEFSALDEQFQSKIALAQVLIQSAIGHGIGFTTVLMDSWFLCREIVTQLEALGKDWISLLKHNRKLLVSSFEVKDAQGQPIRLSGETIKVEDLVPLIPACAYRKISHQERDYWCFTLCVRIEGLGKVRLVISFDNPQLSGTYAVLVTNRTDWSAKEILVRYLRRWTIETFYRDGKQQLGLEAYRMRSLESIKAHWTLVFVAYSLLHLTCLPPPSLKGRAVLPSAPQQSIGAACRQQGQALVESLILFAHALLEQGKSAAAVFERLFAKQQFSLPHG